MCRSPNYHGGSVFDFRFQQDWSVYVLVLQRSLRFGRLLGTVGSCFCTNVVNGIQECDLYKEPMFSYINKFPIPYHLYNFNFPTIFSFTGWTLSMKMLFYHILPSQKATLSIIPYHFTIHPTSKNSIILLFH